jgi:hypothetical protein
MDLPETSKQEEAKQAEFLLTFSLGSISSVPSGTKLNLGVKVRVVP